MPVIGRRPSAFIMENGEVGAVLSESCQRNRGKLQLKDPSTGKILFSVEETPPKGERLAWIASSVEGNFYENEVITPILIMENDSENGLPPLKLRYLRHALNPEIYLYQNTNEVHLYWWANTFTPLTKPNSLVDCQSVKMGPVETFQVSMASTLPENSVPPHIALQRDLDSSLDPIYQGKRAHGVIGRQGSLLFLLAKKNGSSTYDLPGQLPSGMYWQGSVSVVKP